MDMLKFPSFPKISSSYTSEEQSQEGGAARRGRLVCMTVKELRERAKNKKIKGYYSMNKTDLINAIRAKKSPSRSKASSVATSPARPKSASPSPFLTLPPKF